MATTSIWRVNGWLGKVLIYIENPDKTENPAAYEKQGMDGKEAQGLSDVIEYAVQQKKTGKIAVDDEDVPVMQRFVSGVNCSPTTARDEMIAVKKRFGKEEGTVAYHGYQSFAPGEATPEMAHEIGLKLAKALWGEKYQVLVATHLDKAHHLHNHFVVNTVSFLDGIKYHRTEKDYFDMQRESDRLCREYGLSVIENPKRGKSKHYGEWRAEQEGRPTYLSLIKADVDAAIRQSMTERQFFYRLRQMGYDIKVGKDITVRPYDRPHGRKLVRNLGEDYSLENIRKRILAQRRPQRVETPEPRRCRLLGDLKQARKVTGFRALYFHYCYLLGVFPQKQNRQRGHVPHALRNDLIRAEELTDEARLLSRQRVDTLEQLSAYQSDVEARLVSLTEQRKNLYRKLRTKEALADPARQEQIRAEVSALSAQIKALRREVKLCEDIAARSLSLKEKIRAAREEQQAGKTGDAAEQVVRMSLEGAEVALKITGVAAKNLAAALYTILKDQKKTKGKARIEAMLREKRPLKVYTLKKEDCPEFARQAKGYGILYAPIPVRKGDDTIDILVFEDDAARANRIVDKFNLTVVDTASIKEDIEKSREERGGEPQAPEKAAPEKSEDDRLLDELMEKPAQKEKSQPENPSAEKSVPFTPAEEKSHPSAPISENSSKSARGTSDEPQKPSVRQELRDIQAQRKKEAEAAKREEPAAPQKRAAQKTTRHQPPKPKKKPKSKER